MSFFIKIDVNEDGIGILDSSHLKQIRSFFSVENEKRKHIKGSAKQYIPKREFCITEEGKFNIGLLNEIFKYACKLLGRTPNGDEFDVTSKAKYFYEPSFLIPQDYELAKFDGFEYRDIQIEAITSILRRGRGIIEVGTAGGKGLVMASICQTLLNYNPSNTFAIIVPTHLVEKTLTEFIDEYGFKSGDVISSWDGDNKLQPSSRIVVVGQHILNTRVEEFNLHIANRSVVMVDECHIVKREGILTKRMKCIQTNNIIGLTGSLPDKQLDKFNVLGIIGKVVCNIDSRTIKDKGLKADSKIISIRCEGCEVIKRVKKGYSIDGKVYSEAKDAFLAEKEYLLRNIGRNELVTNLIDKICNDGNVLIPVDLDYHEKIVFESVKNLGRKIYIVNGNTPKTERTKIYKEIENDTNAILIAKVGVMREGISINNLSYMVGYFIQKSFVRIVQLIGRIERHGGNTVPIFYDIWDDTLFSKKHYEKRKSIYSKERIVLVEKSATIDYNRGIIHYEEKQ